METRPPVAPAPPTEGLFYLTQDTRGGRLEEACPGGALRGRRSGRSADLSRGRSPLFPNRTLQAHVALQAADSTGVERASGWPLHPSGDRRREGGMDLAFCCCRSRLYAAVPRRSPALHGPAGRAAAELCPAAWGGEAGRGGMEAMSSMSGAWWGRAAPLAAVTLLGSGATGAAARQVVLPLAQYEELRAKARTTPEPAPPPPAPFAIESDDLEVLAGPASARIVQTLLVRVLR